jgi:predicted dehydrogenase
MTKKKIGVGIIGAGPDRGWASDAHIPALRALPDFEFVALSTSRRESAQAASALFNVPLAYDNATDLVSRPEVDVVAVTVKVPFHLELVTAAINAGKAVYCEWPLGNGVAEAEKMVALLRQRGVYGAVGLQARSAPVIRYVRDLVAQGFVGEVLSSSIVASAINWGADIITPYIYLLDKKNGATMLTIPFGHTVDAFCWCLGEFRDLTATFATRRPQVHLVGAEQMLSSNVADQVAVSGTLQNGAVASIHFRGGLSKATNFLWEINGTEGDLLVTADGGHIQMLPHQLKGARKTDAALVDMPVPESYKTQGIHLPDGPAASIARVYIKLAGDLRNGTQTLPGFEDGLIRHRMIEAITNAAETGVRQSYKSTL